MATKRVFGWLICLCNKCGHVWKVKPESARWKPKENEEDKPRDCPRCRSIKWNEGGNK